MSRYIEGGEYNKATVYKCYYKKSDRRIKCLNTGRHVNR